MGWAAARPSGLSPASARLHQPCLPGGKLARQRSDEADAGSGLRMVLVQGCDGGDAAGAASQLARIVRMVQARLRGLDARAASGAQAAGEIAMRCARPVVAAGAPPDPSVRR